MRKCLSAVLAASVLILPAFQANAQSTWHSEERCRLAADPLPAAFARCGTITVPLDPAAPDGPAHPNRLPWPPRPITITDPASTF